MKKINSTDLVTLLLVMLFVSGIQFDSMDWLDIAGLIVSVVFVILLAVKLVVVMKEKA